jgi:hypothetical protein
MPTKPKNHTFPLLEGAFEGAESQSAPGAGSGTEELSSSIINLIQKETGGDVSKISSVVIRLLGETSIHVAKTADHALYLKRPGEACSIALDLMVECAESYMQGILDAEKVVKKKSAPKKRVKSAVTRTVKSK